MNTSIQELREWLLAHKDEITHFRPRRWCKVEMLLPYNRRKEIPYIEGPTILDNAENAALIREILGDGFIEEKFPSMSAGKY